MDAITPPRWDRAILDWLRRQRELIARELGRPTWRRNSAVIQRELGRQDNALTASIEAVSQNTAATNGRAATGSPR